MYLHIYIYKYDLEHPRFVQRLCEGMSPKGILTPL